MYMTVRSDILEFEWDSGNVDKSYQKHGIEQKQIEEVFIYENQIILPDVKHSEKEERKIIVGQTHDRTFLFVVFTMRKTKIRVVSARKMHKEEVERYEKIKKNTKI